MNESKNKKLSSKQTKAINEFLNKIGDYGEIRLIVQRGELRFIDTVESHKVCGPDYKKVRQVVVEEDLELTGQ